MSKKQTLTLVGLPGVRRQKTRAVVVTSVTKATAALREGRAITGAASNGAINVYPCDDGMYRCCFMQNCATVDAATYKYLAAVHQWLKDWWPQMGER